MGVDTRYGQVACGRGDIGLEEPVFVFRAKDQLLTLVLEHYRQLCEQAGSPTHHLTAISDAMAAVIAWRATHSAEVPSGDLRGARDRVRRGDAPELDEDQAMATAVEAAGKARANVAGLTAEHLRESNLIEDITDPAADAAMKRAWRWLVRRRGLDLEAVLETHRLITGDQLGEHAGRLRKVGVRVGGRICPPPQRVPVLLAGWLRDMQRWEALDPRDMHVEFERIHPFIDGNGRVGRLLLFWHQRALKQPVQVIRADQRHEYYRWFRHPDDDEAYRAQLWAMAREWIRDTHA